MLRTQLTPNLFAFATSTLKEIEYALDEEFILDKSINSIFFDMVFLNCVDNETFNRSMDAYENKS